MLFWLLGQLHNGPSPIDNYYQKMRQDKTASLSHHQSLIGYPPIMKIAAFFSHGKRVENW